ncbi:hypothetical protein [Roseisolibacter sp. H3M3-2]|uniref:hypothetical protein n=1 Tax=Roseisolibacter sp. H3M3-2 TaxID=3031323 RepID=UPI0023DA84F4|nr:hypothetical protein [Roseisolibacter sp. H3M3-2]MDF1505840.1 hypothetical protein [Roseisolibacter sp. H3M3-2]
MNPAAATPTLPDRWPAVERHAGAVARAFLERLFVLDPAARAPFEQGDDAARRRRFVDVADAVVGLLHDPDALTAAALPGRRTSVGTVRGRDGALCAAALLHALERTVGDAWGAGGEAGGALYRLLSTTVRWSARRHRRAA